MQIFIRDKSSFKTETCCDDMNKIVSELFEYFNDITEENFDKAFEAYVSVIQKAKHNRHAPLKQMSRKLRN